MTTSAAIRHLDQLQELYSAGFQDTYLDQALQKIISRQIDRDENHLVDIDAQLDEFERQYELTSDNFWEQYQAGQMADTADFMEWNILYKMRQRILTRIEILRDKHFHA
jgi:hypothetical protein